MVKIIVRKVGEEHGTEYTEDELINWCEEWDCDDNYFTGDVYEAKAMIEDIYPDQAIIEIIEDEDETTLDETEIRTEENKCY